MTAVVPTKMVIGHNNVVSAANISTVAYTNATEVAGFSKDNLQYSDPGRLAKFTRDANPITITITFESGVAASQKCFGLIRHNLFSAFNYGAPVPTVEFKNGSTSMGTFNAGSDADTLMIVDGAGLTTATLNIVITKTTTPGTINIGSIFVGSYTELTTNPTDGLLEITREDSIVVQNSSGGTRRLLSLGDRDRYGLSFETRRAQEADVLLFNNTLQRADERHKMVGVIPPWETQAVGVTDMPHFFGYVEKVRVKPRFSAATDLRFDLAVDFIGA